MAAKPSTEKKVELLFKIQGIHISNFSLDNSLSRQSLAPDHSYAFEINAGTLIDASLKIIGVDFITRIFTSQTKDDKVCELSLRISYAIQNFESFTTIEKDKVTIPEQLMHHLIALTISTTRGILFEKLQGSFLSKIILPTINVSSLNKMNSDKPLIQ
ncbi:MAG: hypothetical protein M0Q21_02165 [Ignavibacteriaceae bacterium]|nr:hypothetical protein [Ignavibacteriaceae bacterium]